MPPELFAVLVQLDHPVGDQLPGLSLVQCRARQHREHVPIGRDVLLAGQERATNQPLQVHDRVGIGELQQRARALAGVRVCGGNHPQRDARPGAHPHQVAQLVGQQSGRADAGAADAFVHEEGEPAGPVGQVEHVLPANERVEPGRDVGQEVGAVVEHGAGVVGGAQQVGHQIRGELGDGPRPHLVVDEHGALRGERQPAGARHDAVEEQQVFAVRAVDQAQREQGDQLDLVDLAATGEEADEFRVRPVERLGDLADGEAGPGHRRADGIAQLTRTHQGLRLRHLVLLVHREPTLGPGLGEFDPRCRKPLVRKNCTARNRRFLAQWAFGWRKSPGHRGRVLAQPEIQARATNPVGAAWPWSQKTVNRRWLRLTAWIGRKKKTISGDPRGARGSRRWGCR